MPPARWPVLPVIVLLVTTRLGSAGRLALGSATMPPPMPLVSLRAMVESVTVPTPMRPPASSPLWLSLTVDRRTVNSPRPPPPVPEPA